MILERIITEHRKKNHAMLVRKVEFEPVNRPICPRPCIPIAS